MGKHFITGHHAHTDTFTPNSNLAISHFTTGVILESQRKLKSPEEATQTQGDYIQNPMQIVTWTQD